MNKQKNIAIMASGNGSNAEAIIQYFKHKDCANVALVMTNNERAGVLTVAKKHSVASIVLNKAKRADVKTQLALCEQYKIDYIILAGYLKLVHPQLIEAFPNAITNIHPALLPKYGGKGMYGIKIHQAVLRNNETESGLTIHFVNEQYDEGNIIFQMKCRIEAGTTPEQLAKKILKLEHQYYPQVIENLIRNEV